jgi:hypothetical protein
MQITKRTDPDRDPLLGPKVYQRAVIVRWQPTE